MVTLECVEKLIRKDMVDPVTGEKLTDRDIIVLQRVSGAPWPSGNPALLLEAPPFYFSPALIKPGPPQPASPPQLGNPHGTLSSYRAAPASRAPE